MYPLSPTFHFFFSFFFFFEILNFFYFLDFQGVQRFRMPRFFTLSSSSSSSPSARLGTSPPSGLGSLDSR